MILGAFHRANTPYVLAVLHIPGTYLKDEGDIYFLCRAHSADRTINA